MRVLCTLAKSVCQEPLGSPCEVSRSTFELSEIEIVENAWCVNNEAAIFLRIKPICNSAAAIHKVLGAELSEHFRRAIAQ
jgi:hypothetical protein